MHIFLHLITLLSASESIKLRITSPRHGAAIDLRTGRLNGGINLRVTITVETREQYIHEVDGKAICLYMNGSAVSSMKYVAAMSGPGFLIPAKAWKAGRAWLHIRLCGYTKNHAASSPIMVHILESHLMPLSSCMQVSLPMVTLTLALTIDDAHRALLLVGTIRAIECHKKSIIREVTYD